MATVKRWVCSACGAFWFQPNTRGLCPQCNGTGGEKNCELLPDGSLKVKDA
jgi:rubrerythrin